MLRESGNKTGNAFDLSAITNADSAHGGVPAGKLLTAFVNAILQGTEAEAASARREVRASLGDAAFVDVCATVASFNAVVKIADGSGIPLEQVKEQKTKDIRQSLGIDEFRH